MTYRPSDSNLSAVFHKQICPLPRNAVVRWSRKGGNSGFKIGKGFIENQHYNQDNACHRNNLLVGELTDTCITFSYQESRVHVVSGIMVQNIWQIRWEQKKA